MSTFYKVPYFHQGSKILLTDCGTSWAYMIEAKLDKAILCAWEQDRSAADTTLLCITDFLERRYQMFERIEARGKEENVTLKNESSKHKPRAQEKRTALANVTFGGKWNLCQDDYLIYHCGKFLALTIDERLKKVSQLKLCLNFLCNDHFVRTCKMGSCRKCSGKHNMLPGKEWKCSRQRDTYRADKNDMKSKSVVHHIKESTKRHVLMATAMVNATHPNGITDLLFRYAFYWTALARHISSCMRRVTGSAIERRKSWQN